MTTAYPQAVTPLKAQLSAVFFYLPKKIPGQQDNFE
jgi:hypothetical protein